MRVRLPQPALNFNKAKIMIKEDSQQVHRIIRQMTEPARRHKCELCKSIFECHLCLGFLEDHSNHSIYWKINKNTKIFLCEDCIKKHQLLITIRAEHHNSGYSYKFYDSLSGDLLGRGIIAGQKIIRKKKCVT